MKSDAAEPDMAKKYNTEQLGRLIKKHVIVCSNSKDY